MELNIPYFFEEAQKIKFNPVANTFMKQAISRISNLQNLNLQKNEIQLILEEAQGDLRQACNILQFNFGKKGNKNAKKFKKDSNQSVKSLKVSQNNSEIKKGKDQKLAIFNAIGKVIHQKFVDQDTKQLQLYKMISSINNFACDSRTFRQMLIENSVDHFGEIKDLSQCYEYFSVVEMVENQVMKNFYGESAKQQLDQSCSVIISMAVSILNTNKINLGFRPVGKAQSKIIAREYKQSIKQARLEYCGINFEKGGQFFLQGGSELMNLLPNLVNNYKEKEQQLSAEDNFNDNEMDDPVEQ